MRRLFPIVAGLVFVGLACACPGTGGLQGTIGVMQKTIGSAMTEVPGMLTEFPKTLEAMTQESALPGKIRGRLSYPSESLPAQRVIAFRASSMEVEADVTTAQGQGEYELSVAAGDYFIVAYTVDGILSAGYTQAVPCGLSVSCKDHSLIKVHVDAGAVVENINPQDWYAGEGAFPAMP
jgi:hypothetical protein